MYNFLVTAEKNAWDNESYSYDRTRFLEYTDKRISQNFTFLTDSNIQKIINYPTLFAYEGKDLKLSLGRIKSKKERDNGKTIFFDFEIILKDKIDFAQLELLTKALDIRDWEMNRTH